MIYQQAHEQFPLPVQLVCPETGFEFLDIDVVMVPVQEYGHITQLAQSQSVYHEMKESMAERVEYVEHR